VASCGLGSVAKLEKNHYYIHQQFQR